MNEKIYPFIYVDGRLLKRDESILEIIGKKEFQAILVTIGKDWKKYQSIVINTEHKRVLCKSPLFTAIVNGKQKTAYAHTSFSYGRFI